ncbi:lysophospholipid acyltransferase family protein [Herbiconiux daphne]|uniref:1-acyl-sn-glycerol-3-phosphate acyltransferase n=1 Tax=Herbiconiux daphne TaxID=2970914 RepID=A0ABT2H1A0_9MICO|nr:lysophospholipid acyltransferase family protein [Herbiconiux daphne]MCS5733716.1 1-acyl-sn-glycerol-3-phosphate acyltransferase [Herbiconiux daphne]
MPRRAPEPIYTVAIGLGRAFFGALRLKHRATGLENIPATGGAVYAMTHFGYLEFALVEWQTWLHNRRRVRFMATKRAFDKPVVGSLLRGMKHIEVDMAAGGAAYAEAVAALRRGEIIGVFPEAGVSASFTVRELKSGAVRLAAEAGVPVIPVAVWGGQRLLTKNRRVRMRDRVGVEVDFAFGRPIVVSPDDSVADTTAELRSTLQQLTDTLQEDYPQDGTGQWWQPRRLGGTAPTVEEAAASDAEREVRRAAAKAAAE